MTMLINDDKYGAGHFRKKYKIFFSFNYYYPVNSYCMHPYLKRDNVKSNVTRRKKSKNTLNYTEELPFKGLCRLQFGKGKWKP